MNFTLYIVFFGKYFNNLHSLKKNSNDFELFNLFSINRFNYNFISKKLFMPLNSDMDFGCDDLCVKSHPISNYFSEFSITNKLHDTFNY